jgi:hypothetical protein
MSDLTEFGQNLRDLLQGLVLGAVDRPSASSSLTQQSVSWARRLDKSALPELYADNASEPPERAFPTSAVHHVMIKTLDTFSFPGGREVTVELNGYSQVVVVSPPAGEWGKDVIYVNYTEHKLFGSHPVAGTIAVTLNPAILSGGNIFPSPTNRESQRADMACRVNLAALFQVEQVGATLFNKTPVQIASNNLHRVPPLHEGGTAHVFSLPLYRVSEPDGDLVGYIDSLDYQVLGYAPRALVASYRSAQTSAELVDSLRAKHIAL